MLSSHRSSGFGFIAPLLVLMVVAFNAPIICILGLAFWEKGRGFTLEHYEGLIETPVYLRVLGNTLRISLIATVANVAIGYPLAHWMRGLPHRARLIAMAMVSATRRNSRSARIPTIPTPITTASGTAMSSSATSPGASALRATRIGMTTESWTERMTTISMGSATWKSGNSG